MSVHGGHYTFQRPKKQKKHRAFKDSRLLVFSPARCYIARSKRKGKTAATSGVLPAEAGDTRALSCLCNVACGARQLLMDQNGLIVVFTGNGKGKTSAALGVALRATGHKMYVSLVQFIKSGTSTGEAMASERLAPELEFLSRGRGFVNCCGSTVPLEEHRKAAAEALVTAGQRMHAGWDIVIMDEINTAVALGLIPLQEVLDLIKRKPPRLHLILTGRDAHPDLIAIADLVTEMRSVKHPYEEGRPARKGIDF